MCRKEIPAKALKYQNSFPVPHYYFIKMTACCHCPAVRWRLCPRMGRWERERDEQSERVTLWQWIWGMGKMIQPLVWLIQGSLSTRPGSRHLWVFIVWQQQWTRKESKNKLAYFVCFFFLKGKFVDSGIWPISTLLCFTWQYSGDLPHGLTRTFSSVSMSPSLPLSVWIHCLWAIIRVDRLVGGNLWSRHSCHFFLFMYDILLDNSPRKLGVFVCMYSMLNKKTCKQIGNLVVCFLFFGGILINFFIHDPVVLGFD